jgi:transposase
LTSKIHAVVDTNGLPIRLALTAGEVHDNRLARKLLSRLKSGAMLLADRGYDADWIRTLAAERGAWAKHPARVQSQRADLLQPVSLSCSQCDRAVLQQDQTVSEVATRYDKLAANYLAFVQLASIRLWLRVNEYTA